MSEAVVEKTNKKPRAVKKRKIFIGVDKTPEDVLKYINEGHNLYFEDEAETFLKLDESIVAELSRDATKRYRFASAKASGVDVMGGVVEATLGYDPKAYNVQPGSAASKTEVMGKDPNKDYYWMTDAKLAKHEADGYVVDKDTNVRTRNSAGTVKDIGGTRKREMILGSRPKAVTEELKKRKRETRARYLQGSQDAMRETFDRAGVRVVEN